MEDVMHSGNNGHVVMLVNNPCVNDSRVIKSAEALVAGGWRVTVVCRHHETLPLHEERKGVTYHRVRSLPKNVKDLKTQVASRSGGKKAFGSAARVMRALGEDLTSRVDQASSASRAFAKRTFPSFLLSVSKYAYSKTVRASRRARAAWTSVCSKSARTIRHVGTLKSKLKGEAKVFRGTAKKLILQPLKAVYWFHEMDEFESATLQHILQIRPDVVHCHDLSTLPTGASVAGRIGCALIYDSHELEMHRNATYPEAVKRKRRRLEERNIVKADVVITVSESIADHLRDDYRIPRPIVVLNSPDFEHTDEGHKTLRTDLHLGEDAPLAVYVGSVTINRGIENVVRALPFMEAVHFATVGPRRKETEKLLIEIAEELGVRDRLHLVDPVPPNDVVGYIRSADVSVLPIQNVCLSYYYCMPNKLLESVFAGIPVAVANLIELRRFVEKTGCGLVMDETDPRSIAEAVASVIPRRGDFVVTGERLDQLIAEYSWAAQAERLRGVYRDLRRRTAR